MTPLEEILNAKIAQLQREYAQAVAEKDEIIAQQNRKIAQLTGGDLTSEDHAALKVLDEARGTYVETDAVAARLGISGQRADFILGKLRGSGHAFEHGQGKSFRIEQKGKSAVHGSSV